MLHPPDWGRASASDTSELESTNSQLKSARKPTDCQEPSPANTTNRRWSGKTTKQSAKDICVLIYLESRCLRGDVKRL